MYADEAAAPPPALDLSQEELRKRLRALPPGFDKNALKPLKMLSRTGRATAKRRKTQEQFSRTAPGLMKRTQATNAKGVLSTERAALALTSRHVLSKPHKVRQVISPTRSILSVEEAAVVPYIPEQKKVVSFLDSLELSNEQMASFIDDAGSFLYLTRRSRQSSAYDLRVCEWAEVDESDYFTVSCNGVTQFERTDSEFTSLNVFEKEYKDYHAMARIPFFFKYRSWKTFQVWKKARSRRPVRCLRLVSISQ